MADKMGFNLTETQEYALEKLRTRVLEELSEFRNYNKNFVLYRFLQARDWDVNKAEIMLKKCVQWRRQNNMHNVVKEYQPPKIFQEYIANVHIGNDKEGCPVFYYAFGKFDVKGYFKSIKPFEVDKSMARLFELHEIRLEKKMKKMNKWLAGFVVILDLNGLTLANATNMKGIETLIRQIKTMQDNVPERLKSVFIINAPAIFSFPFNIVKSFLSLETQNKLHYFSTDGWQEVLLTMIDADQLPKFLGGTRTDPDGNPLCKTFINHLGIIDESYYLDKNGNNLANSPGVINLNVSRCSTKKIPLKVNEAGCVIEWEFETKTGDIGFGLFYKETTDNEDQVRQAVSLEKVETKACIENGMYKCEIPGDYFVVFDNSYSRFKSKEIFYRLKVLYPNELK